MSNKWFLALLPLLFLSCSPKEQGLTKVHLTNQKGFIETITNKERLKEFENDQALYHQPHKKVVRTFKKGNETRIIITTYHPNGQIYQLLESIEGNACGHYKEWHPNSTLKIKAYVISGIPDIDISGQNTWTFEGRNEAFDEEGNRIASFNYTNGSLEGMSTIYFPSGTIKEKRPYTNNLLNGTLEVFNEAGVLVEKTLYESGKKAGYSHKYWGKNKPASQEMFENGLLKDGVYFDSLGNLLGQIKNGCGQKAFFKEDLSFELHEYLDGRPWGNIQIFDRDGLLINSFYEKNGQKSGKEVVYYPKSKQEKLSIDWVDGRIHGVVKTWYPTGHIESQKEMSLNKKQGILTAWYADGNLMLVEEYENDSLLKGKYFEKGHTTPISTLSNGQGLVTLFDEKGIFIKKVAYYGGKPVE